jgi:hypothetical protein
MINEKLELFYPFTSDGNLLFLQLMFERSKRKYLPKRNGGLTSCVDRIFHLAYFGNHWSKFEISK